VNPLAGLSTIKLIGLAIAAASILSFVLLAFHWKNTMTERGEKLAAICQTTRAASGQPKLKCSEVPAQIQFMGEAIGTLTTAIHKQNDAVAAMGEKTAQLQAESAKASQAAQERAQGAQATSTRLEASSRSGERQAKPCELSKELKGSWQ
jgi:hypothetical protein